MRDQIYERTVWCPICNAVTWQAVRYVNSTEINGQVWVDFHAGCFQCQFIEKDAEGCLQFEKILQYRIRLEDWSSLLRDYNQCFSQMKHWR